MITVQRLLIFACVYMDAYAKIKRTFNKIIQFGGRHILSTPVALNAVTKAN